MEAMMKMKKMDVEKIKAGLHGEEINSDSYISLFRWSLFRKSFTGKDISHYSLPNFFCYLFFILSLVQWFNALFI